LSFQQTPPDKSTSATPVHLAVPKQPKYSTSASKNSDVTPPTKAEPIPSKRKWIILLNLVHTRNLWFLAFFIN